MSPKPLRISNTTLITCVDDQPCVLENRDILIEGNRILRVEQHGHSAKADQADIIDGSQHLTIPGLINTHHHLYQTLTRGLKCVQNAPLFQWLTELYKRWQHVDYEAIKIAAKVSMAELLLSGCTTTSDHFYLFPQGTDVAIEAVLESADELGMRIHACRGSMTLGQSHGGLPPDCCTEQDDGVLRDCQRAVERYHDPSAYAMQKIDLAPCSPFNVTSELFAESASLARSLGVLLHTHAAETVDEQKYCLERFGVRPIQYLQDHGWLGEDVYLAHCVCLSDDEIQALATTGTGVAHCPCSNMRLGSGIPAVTKMLNAGVTVGLGVDGSSSNDGGHALSEARQAMLLQRVIHGPSALSVEQAFAMATIGGAKCLSRDRLGRIHSEYAADLVMINRRDIALAGSVVQDPLGALMLCHVPRVDRTIIDGKVVVEDGRLTSCDQDELADALNRTVRGRFDT